MPHAYVLPGWGTHPDRLAPLCDGLRAHGIEAAPWPYRPVGSIREIGGRLADRVATHDGPVHLLGHSLGGLAAASAVLDHGAGARTVTTINAPWRGTWAALTAHPGDPLGRELRWGADALARLRELLATHLAAPEGPRWTVVSAAGDLAAPATTALRVPDGERLERALVGAGGHSVSLLNPRLVDRVVAAVLDPA